MSKQSKQHYVNNKHFLEEMIVYRKDYLKSKKANLPPPRISEYIGQCIYSIATKFATKPNFSSYTFKDEMILDAIFNCIKYIHNFDPEKSNNPFAYFSQIASNSFIARIQKENKQQVIKMKAIDEYAINQESTNKHTPEFERVKNEMISSFDSKKKKRNKKVKSKTGISLFMDSEIEE